MPGSSIFPKVNVEKMILFLGKLMYKKITISAAEGGRGKKWLFSEPFFGPFWEVGEGRNRQIFSSYPIPLLGQRA